MVVLCGCFKKGCLQVLGEVLSGSLSYDYVHVKITLVSDKDERERWIAEEVYKLIIEGLHHLEALLAVNGVDQDISVNIHGVLGGEDVSKDVNFLVIQDVQSIPNGLNVCLSYLLRINRNAILLLYWIFF